VTDGTDWLDLLDWRRRVAELYRRVRALRGDNMVPAHTLWIDERSRLFRDHPQSPVPASERDAFGRLRSWPYDPALAFTAPLRPLPRERVDGPVSVEGHPVPLLRIGAVDLPVGTLEVFWVDDYGGGLFLPFADATSGTETYGAGRYLLDSAKGADLGSAEDGALHVDFNFAYQPSCAWDPAWACPLAPPANRLPAPVRAGERLK